MSRSPRPPRSRQNAVPSSSSGAILKSVSIDNLFGKYSYDHLDFSQGSRLSTNVSVLIGDNGSGKTTLLRLIYAALSPEDQAGLRTYIAKTPFNGLRIELVDGKSVSITKKNLTGPFTVDVVGTEGADGQFQLMTDDDDNVRASNQKGQVVERLHSALRALGIDILLIDHVRKIRSTYELLASIKTNENTIARERIIRPTFMSRDEIAERSRIDLIDFPLAEIIAAVHEWFRVRAFRQGTTGEQDASSVYLEVVKTLSRRGKQKPLTPQTQEELLDELDELNDLTSPFIRHGLLSRYPFEELGAIIKMARKTDVGHIQSVIAPFLTSIRRRLDALNAIQKLISIYEEELNQYFRDKVAAFHILEGLRISDGQFDLSPESLSSGERQLVFLLSAAILARAGRSLILIDEPELSLNYKWQRLIAQSLARVASDSDTQFIMASHSIEIISRHVDSIVEL